MQIQDLRQTVNVTSSRCKKLQTSQARNRLLYTTESLGEDKILFLVITDRSLLLESSLNSSSRVDFPITAQGGEVGGGWRYEGNGHVCVCVFF